MSSVRDILQKINRIDKVTGAILSSYEGIIIDSLLREGKDDTLQAGVSSHKLTKIKEICQRLNFGNLHQLNLYGADGMQCLYAFSGKFLVVNCHKDANINYVSMELKPLIQEINLILSR